MHEVALIESIVEHEHHHADHHGAGARIVPLEPAVLAKNDRLAAANRALFQAHEIAAFNFTSAPGSGKKSLLVTLIESLAGRVPLAVIEGDQETSRDADRIRATG